MYLCVICEMSFDSEEILNQHLHAKHSSEKPFSCEVCCMQFSHSDELTEHSVVHSGSNFFPCEYCGQSFPTAMSQINHLYKCEAVDRVSGCSSDSDSEEDFLEQEQSQADMEVTCESCHATISEADAENHVCQADSENDSVKNECVVEENLYASGSCSGVQPPKDSNEQSETILCANCKATLSEADLISHNCTNEPGKKLFVIDGEVYQIESIRTSGEEMIVGEIVFEDSAVSRTENCNEALAEHSSSNHPDNDAVDQLDNQGDDKDTFLDVKTSDFDTSSVKSNLTKQYNKGSTKRSSPKCNEKVVQYSGEAVLPDNLNQIVEVIIVEPKLSNVQHESEIEDDASEFSVKTEVESKPEDDSDNPDVHNMRADFNFSLNSQLGPKTFTCPQCPLVFTLKHTLITHLKEVHLEDIYDCKRCKMLFTTIESLKEHSQKAHACFDSHSLEWNEELNDDCDSTCEFEEEFEEEAVKPPKSKKENKQTFPCNFCSKQFFHLNSLKSHMSFFHLNEDDSGVCPKCNEVIENRVAGKPHKCPTECKICGKRFKAFYLKQHMNSHMGLKPFTCPECPMVFSHKHNLTRHLKNIHAESNLQCKHCEMFFSNKQMLRAHYQQAHASKTATYQCEDCGLAPMKIQRYLKHRKMFHGKGQTFPCPFCEKVCLDGRTFKDHLKSHESKKTFECLDCPKTFTMQKSYTRHTKHHAAAKSFKCNQCDKSFHSNSHLQAHMRIHTGEKPFKCQECGKAFTQQGSLSHHVRVHIGKMPCPSDECMKPFPHKCTAKHRVSRKSFDCTLCEKSFYSCSQLRNHVRVHTGEKPHKCQECGKSFAQQGTLLYHMRSHAGERPYSCSECHKSFIHRGGLNSHKCRKAS